MAAKSTVEASAREIIEVEIAQIRQDLQVRAKGTNAAVVADYARAMRGGAKFPPVLLFRQGDKLHLADGAHRVAAVLKNDGKTIQAEIRKGDRLERLTAAIQSGDKVALRFSTADKRRAIELVIATEPKMLNEEVARLVGVDAKTVKATRNRLANQGLDIPAAHEPGGADAVIVRKLTKQIERLFAMWPTDERASMQALAARFASAEQTDGAKV